MARGNIDLGLERMSAVMALLGNPHLYLTNKIIHVTGTNGKGSVCSTLEQLLLNYYKDSDSVIGKFTSPFLRYPRDEISIQGCPISQNDYESLGRQVDRVIQDMQDDKLNPTKTPTLFERQTCIAFLAFQQFQCSYVILEVGMGGRRDATNICPPPLMCILTSISHDHHAYLGPELSDIVYEKLGIVKPGTPYLLLSPFFSQEHSLEHLLSPRCSLSTLLPSTTSLLTVPSFHCLDHNLPPNALISPTTLSHFSKCTCFPIARYQFNQSLTQRQQLVKKEELEQNCALLSFSLSTSSLLTFYAPLHPNNVATAVSAFLLLLSMCCSCHHSKNAPCCSKEEHSNVHTIISHTTFSIQWPGRQSLFHIPSSSHAVHRHVLVDGAHNDESMSYLIDTLCTLLKQQPFLSSHYNEKSDQKRHLVVILSITQGKDLSTLLAPFLRLHRNAAQTTTNHLLDHITFFITEYEAVESMPWLKATSKETIRDALTHLYTTNALNQSVSLILKNTLQDCMNDRVLYSDDPWTLVTGSLYLVSQFYRQYIPE